MSIPDYSPPRDVVERIQNENAERSAYYDNLFERFMPAYTGPCGGDVCDNPEITMGDSCPKCVHTRRR